MANKMVDIKTPDGTADAYVSYPDDGKTHPAVLLFMDAVGLRPNIKQMADRIAAAGYYVLAPNTFYREGRAPLWEGASILGDRPRLMQLVMSLTPDRVKADAGAYLDFLGKQKEVTPGSKVGATGYCMGATHVMRTAAAYPDRVAAGAGFHPGGLVSDDPNSPHKLVGQIKARLYFGHADEDPFNTPEQQAKLSDALKSAGRSFRAELYNGAKHGYTMADLPVYDKNAAEKHWTNLLGLFKEALPA